LNETFCCGALIRKHAYTVQVRGSNWSEMTEMRQ